jgi:hypothetical protein
MNFPGNNVIKVLFNVTVVGQIFYIIKYNLITSSIHFLNIRSI